MSLIYTQALPNEKIEEMIFQGQREDLISSAEARTLLGKNMTENPNHYFKGAAEYLRDAFKDDPAGLAQAMDYLTETARALTYDQKGKVSGQFKQEDLLVVAKNYAEPTVMEKVGKVTEDSFNINPFGGFGQGLNREEKATISVWDKQFLGTVEQQPLTAGIANELSPDGLERQLLGGRDKKELSDIEKKHLQNNIRLMELGQEHGRFYLSTFGKAPFYVGVDQNGAAVFLDKGGSLWTVRVDESTKDEAWYIYKAGMWVKAVDPVKEHKESEIYGFGQKKENWGKHPR